jgi:hypothetical protein
MSITVPPGILEIIRSEYQEMPELRLTVPQAGRLWNLEPSVAEALLEVLVRDGFLRQMADGRYGRVDAR